MNNLKSYHISAAILVVGSICLIIFTNWWLFPGIGLLIAYELVHEGMKQEENCKCHEQNGCKKDCGNDNNGTVVSDDSDSNKEN